MDRPEPAVAFRPTTKTYAVFTAHRLPRRGRASRAEYKLFGVWDTYREAREAAVMGIPCHAYVIMEQYAVECRDFPTEPGRPGRITLGPIK
jgi:hypothetical protein